MPESLVLSEERAALGLSGTPRARPLRADVPRSLHHAARFWAAPGSWAAWGHLDAAMTGGVPHVDAWGMEWFDYLHAHPNEARGFDAMMANFTDNRHEAIAAAYDFSGIDLIADVGGGNGETLRNILTRFPGTRGLVFDRRLARTIMARCFVSFGHWVRSTAHLSDVVDAPWDYPASYRVRGL